MHAAEHGTRPRFVGTSNYPKGHVGRLDLWYLAVASAPLFLQFSLKHRVKENHGI
jgi:hypothetical protein